MASPQIFRDLRVWQADNWRFFAGSPVGNVYGEPGWVCQDSANGLFYVHGAGNDTANWLAVAASAAAALAFATVNNAGGNSALSPTARIQTVNLIVSVADGRTSVGILSVAGRLAGDLLFLRLASAVAGVTVELRNAVVGGTLLDTFLSASGSQFDQFVFNGAAWELTTSQNPA